MSWDEANEQRPLVDPRAYALVHLALVPLLIFAVAWSLQHSFADMAIARVFGGDGAEPFPLRHSAWLDIIGHQSARALPVLVGTIAVVIGLLPVRYLDLPKNWRVALVALGGSMLLGTVLVASLKLITTQHCPSVIQEFGGVIPYAIDSSQPFWTSAMSLAGRCLPSGHAAGGYALLGLYFMGWSVGRAGWRWAGLVAGIAAGLVFSGVRLLQGAHFASATVWSAEVQWTVAALIFMPLICRRRQRDG